MTCRLLTAVLLALTGCATSRAPDPDSFFPMNPGTRWTYARHAEVAGPIGVVTNDATVLCRVEESRRTPGYVAARCSALPTLTDVWSASATSHAPGILLRAGYGQYHVLDADGWTEPVVRECSLLLDAPLAAGKRWGDFGSVLRDDGWYGWRVTAGQRRFLRGIRGVAGWWPRRVYELEYATCPDRQRMTFAPGIGIVAYEYHHNGTPADVTLKLVEFEHGTAEVK